MSADIIQLRDYQNKRDLERAYQSVETEISAMEFNAQLAVWPDFSAAHSFHAPDKDPA